jgi:transcriptional regulator with XRE-family HTH domain
VDRRHDISTKLREERQRKRISLRDMAKKLGISAPYLSDVELGRRNISSALLEKLRKLK